MIWFGWVGFYGISTIVGYLMVNTLYTYIKSKGNERVFTPHAPALEPDHQTV